jgi:hypothetical protein
MLPSKWYWKKTVDSSLMDLVVPHDGESNEGGRPRGDAASGGAPTEMRDARRPGAGGGRTQSIASTPDESRRPRGEATSGGARTTPTAASVECADRDA